MDNFNAKVTFILNVNSNEEKLFKEGEDEYFEPKSASLYTSRVALSWLQFLAPFACQWPFGLALIMPTIPCSAWVQLLLRK